MIKYVLIIWLIFFCSVISLPKTPPPLIEAADKQPIVNAAVVRVNDICSGVIVSPNYVVTAAHCIKNPLVAYIKFFDHSRKVFKVKYIGTPASPRDFAILYGDTKSLPSIPLSSRIPHFLEKLTHYGYNNHPNQWATPGMYLHYMCTSQGCEYYIACKVVPGDSGGAIVSDMTGEVVGIAYASYWPAHIGVAVMVPSEMIIEALDMVISSEPSVE